MKQSKAAMLQALADIAKDTGVTSDKRKGGYQITSKHLKARAKEFKKCLPSVDTKELK